MKFFSKIPFVRLIIPFLLGILICVVFGVNLNVILPLIVLFIIISILYYIKLKVISIICSRIYLFTTDLFLILSAIQAFYIINIKNDVNYFGLKINNGESTWVGRIIEIPVHKEKFIKLLIELDSISSQNKMTACKGLAIGYVNRKDLKFLPKPNQQFKVISKFIEPSPPLNPMEFNYKEYLNNKNIYYQTFIHPDNCNLINTNDFASPKTLGLKIKYEILAYLNNQSLSSDASDLLSALLTGFDDEINSDKINAFAHSGTLHVLSVSGLHTGIIYAFIVFILGLIDRNNKFKVLRLVLILLMLWLYVFICGLSPPILRAALMLSFISIGQLYFNYLQNISVNVLAVSAFLILLFNPLLIYDVGFLLSYSAVLGILILTPKLSIMFQPKHVMATKVWKIICISLSAQISTLPITLYFFHQFPIWFAFSNLVIIPLCTFLMFLGFAFLFKLTFLSIIINYLTELIYKLVGLTNNNEYGYFDKIDFSLSDMLLLSLILLLFTLFIRHRKFSQIVITLALVIIWQMNSILNSMEIKSQKFISIQQINRSTSFFIKNKNLLIQLPTLPESVYNFHLLNYYSSLNYPREITCKVDYVKHHTTSLLKISDISQLQLINFLKPDVLLITNNFQIFNDFKFFYQPKKIIADGSNSYQTLKRLKIFCEKSHIKFYSTKESGFIQLNL